MHNNLLLYLLSFLPILLLIIISLKKGVKIASLVSFLITLMLFFYWQNPINYLFASLTSAAFITFDIFLIVFGAIFLFNTMKDVGLINKISHSLDCFHPSKEIRFFLLTISLTTLFEAVAGFGTPGALVPFLLVSLGYNPILSIAAVLLFDAVAVTFGAIGTPILIGLKAPLKLTILTTAKISFLAGTFSALAGLLILFFTLKLYEKYQGKMEYKKKIIVIYILFSIPFVLLSYFLPDLASVLSPIIMLVLAYFYLHHTHCQLKLKPWIPYIILILLLLLPRFIPEFWQALNWQFTLSNLFSTNISAGSKIFRSPLWPLLITGFGLLVFYKSKFSSAKTAFNKSLSVIFILFPIISISQLMLHSNFVFPSMIEYLAKMFSTIGPLFYLVASPFLGIAGTFVAGSNTISNIIFGPAQLTASQFLNLPTELVLALQTLGGALGNAICLFNIIAATTIINFKDHHKILKLNLLPTLLAGFFISLLGIIYYFFLV